MKKMLKYLLFAVPALMLSVACNDVEQAELDPSYLTESIEFALEDDVRVKLYVDATESTVYPMIVGESLTLEYVSTPAPEEVTFPGMTWSSSDEAVVTVSQEGLVSAVGAGTAVVTVRPDTPNRVAVANLTIVVSETLVPATAIDVTVQHEYWDREGTTPACYEGETMTMKAAITPAEATYQTVKWSSEDESIAVVDMVTGVVTGVKQGYTNIVATALDPNSTVKATKRIFVDAIVNPVAIKLTNAPAAGDVFALLEKTFTAKFETQPTLATNSMIEWTTSDATIATVDKGVVTFVGFGEATITAKCTGEGEAAAGFAKEASFKVVIPKGYIREEFANAANVTWRLNPSHYGSTELKVGDNGDDYIAVTCKDNGNNFRGDFQINTPNITLHNGNYPFIAVRLDYAKDFYPAEDIDKCNISFDWAGGVSESGLTYAIGGKLNNNAWTTCYMYSDKSRVIIYDLTERQWGTGGVLPTNESVTFTTAQFKYADVKFKQNYPTTPWTYRVFWIESFASMDAVIAKMNAEAEKYGYTYEVTTSK